MGDSFPRRSGTPAGDEPPLAGRITVVTGASSGIGRAVALALAAQRATVCLVGRDRDRLADVAHRAGPTSPRVLIQQADLSREDEVQQLAGRLQAELTGIDILVHSAGVFRPGAFTSAATEDFDFLYHVNARAPYRLTQALLPLLRASRGQVVFINSTAALGSATGHGLYAASKHALRALADGLRQEVNADGIRVLSVYPGRVATPLQREVFAKEGRSYDPAALLQAEDIAAMVIAAASLPHGAEVTDISLRPTRKSY